VVDAMGIAEFIIGRAFARPVGSTHPTICELGKRSEISIGSEDVDSPGMTKGR